MVPRVKKLISIAALLLVTGLLVSNWHKGRQADKAAPAGTLTQSQAARVVVQDHKLTAALRQADGSVQTQVKYVPPEGRAEIVQPKDGAVQISVKRAGFTFRPAVQGLVGKESKAGLGVRVAYFNRYGAGLGLDTDLDIYLFADRRLDDVAGFLKNTSAGVYGARGKAGLMIGVYFG